MLYKKNKEEKLDLKLFENPTSEYRGTPFWAWNCEMNTEMLGEQIDCLREMGFGGFHMHSRAGMAMPYLKEEFMSLVRFCVDKAKKDGMLAYLYDEDKWPSGAAGGYVTKTRRYRQRMLCFSVDKKEHFPYDAALDEGKTYLLGTYDIVLNENGELSEYTMIDENAAAKGTKWYAYLMTAEESPWYNNQTYIDTLSKEAVDRFIEITYEAYREAVGGEFGEIIHSMFTDEPQFVEKKTLGFADSREDATFPWTFTTREEFLDDYGYDIVERIPEIIWNLPGGEASTARYHYHDHTCEKFTRAFADNCGKWCSEHGISLTGHVLNEATLHIQTASLGEAMRSYRAFGIPGIDMLCDFREYTTAKQCQSAVHQYGREAMLSELYGVTNWDFDFRGHKFQGDWQAALGVTVRVPHLSWVTMAGEAKRDYPASISYQSPWYKEYSYIEDHFARVNTALTRGKPVVKVAVIHPIESYWINFGPIENTLDIRKQLDEKFRNITEWLLFGMVDFDFVCEALLPDIWKDTDDKFTVGEMGYDVVIVPDCMTIRGTTLRALKAFSEKGGKVIFAGSCPKYVDAAESREAEELYNRAERVAYDKISIINALSDYRTVEIRNANGASSENLIYNMREDNDCRWLFIAHGSDSLKLADYASYHNEKEVTRGQKIRITVTGEYKTELYDTMSGRVYALPSSVQSGKTVIDYELYISDSLLIRLSEYDGAEAERKEAEKPIPSRLIRFGRVDYEREEPNVLLLDRAQYSLNGEPMNDEEEILKLDNICRKRLGWPLRGGHFAQPWVVEEEPVENYITLKFTVNSELEAEGACLAIEDAEKLEIALNGEKVPAEVCGWYVDKCIKTVRLPKIKIGENELVVKVPLGKRTNTEWCYIIGEFGVRLEGSVATIVKANDKIGFSSVVSQGMPFYGGNITYKTEIETEDCEAIIRANYYRGALVRVKVDGEDKGVIAFSPYRLPLGRLEKGRHKVEITLFGNRINTFGGMHNVPQAVWVGPDYWRTEDDMWCYEYVLKDMGILASPVIEIYGIDKK